MSFILATVLDKLENTGYPVPLLSRKKEFRGIGILLYFKKIYFLKLKLCDLFRHKPEEFDVDIPRDIYGKQF